MSEEDEAGVGAIIPYLLVDGASDAIDFYCQAFDAEEIHRLDMANGQVGHAQVRIGASSVYLADDPGGLPGNAGNPRRLGGTSVLLHRYVPDVDASVAQAAAAGATVVRPPEDQFYGERAAAVVDPWGHEWSLHTRIREMTEQEIAEAARQHEA